MPLVKLKRFGHKECVGVHGLLVALLKLLVQAKAASKQSTFKQRCFNRDVFFRLVDAIFQIANTGADF